MAKNVAEIVEKERKNEYIPTSFLFNYFGNEKRESDLLNDVGKEVRLEIVKDFETIKQVPSTLFVLYINKRQQKRNPL